MKIDFQRLKRDLDELSRIGRGPNRAIYRTAFSENDLEARAWLRGRMEEAGLDFYQDGAANLCGRLNWDDSRPAVVMGSHIDTVPGGGSLDGALGVLVALEAFRRIREEGISTRSSLEMVAFSDEEGRFGGLFGSQAYCGELTPEAIHNAVDLEGISISEIMESMGLNAMEALQARRNPQNIRSYLELHIEQGPVLDRLGHSLGIVEGITGLLKWSVRLLGTPNHAGTTPMNMRNDAFLGLAELAGEIPRILEEEGSEQSVATIGRVQLQPGAANTVPGLAEFTMDIRDGNQEILLNLGDAFRRTLSAVARRRNLMFEFDILNEVVPVACDPSIMEMIRESALELGVEGHRMPSGAAHDAQIMARIAPVGMIFVPSKDGRSHSPAEWTPWEDIELGANVALGTLLRMAEAEKG